MSINKAILRSAVGLAIGAAVLGVPSLAHAQAALTVKFVQQRGLLYIPVDIMVSGGVLQAGPGGSVRLQFAAPVRVERAERFAISVEPVGGVAAPAGKIIMTGN